jgi:Ca2+-binding RTX toxin-like protein
MFSKRTCCAVILGMTVAGALYSIPAVAATARCQGQLATIVGNDRANLLRGTDHKDVIVARAGADTIVAKMGADVICAGEGADVISAGAGNDSINAGPGQDEVFAGAGDDVAYGNEHDDKLFGKDGSDVLETGLSQNVRNGMDEAFGGAGDDHLIGDASLQLLSGDEGHDLIESRGAFSAFCDCDPSHDEKVMGGEGNDKLVGGPVSSEWTEMLRLAGGPGDDTIDRGEVQTPDGSCCGGNAVLDYSEAPAAVTVDLAASSVEGGDSDVIVGSFEGAIGSVFDDTLTGDPKDNVLYGNFGNDHVDGAEGNDHLNGGEGSDSCLNGEFQVSCES